MRVLEGRGADLAGSRSEVANSASLRPEIEPNKHCTMSRSGFREATEDFQRAGGRGPPFRDQRILVSSFRRLLAVNTAEGLSQIATGLQSLKFM